MACKLCLKDTPLVKSHIIPGFMFKKVFDEKHKIVEVDFKDDSNTKFKSDTGYDMEILCKDCDTVLISKLESYANSVLFNAKRGKKCGVTEIQVKENKDLETHRLQGLDYHQAKLFFLSILFRASITMQPFFKEVALGTFEEKIRQMLISGDAGQDKDFKIIMMKLQSDNSRPFHSVITPRKATQNHNTYYIFYVNLYVVYINISALNQISLFDNGYISEAGEMDIYHVSGELAVQFFDGILGRGVNYKGPFLNYKTD